MYNSFCYISKVCSPPPLMKITWPLVQLEIGAAKYNTAPAISSASPNLWIGVCFSMAFSNSGVRTVFKAAVLVAPGPIALTLILFGP